MKRIVSKRARRAIAAVARGGHSHTGEQCQDCKSFRHLLLAALSPLGAVGCGGMLAGGYRRRAVAVAVAGRRR
jgi:hypothetical protein